MSKVFIITGTRKGIGKQLAEYYLGKGFIVVGCSRKESNIVHENYAHHLLDVSDEKAVIKMVRDTFRRYKRIDVLLNNAGIASMNHIILTPKDTANKIFNTNFLGTFLFLREVAKVMIRQKYGRIVNFTTIAVPLKLDGEAIYVASKSAIESISIIAAKEFGDTGITVNCVGPALMRTNMIENIPKHKIDSLLQQQTIKRFGELKDITNAIDFFIDDKSEFITGQIIYLGGISA